MGIYVIPDHVLPFRGQDGLFHFVYETKNLITGNVYVGKHSTRDFTTDTYIGSGHILKNAIKSCGRNNFVCTILAFFDSEIAAYSFEATIVTEDFILLDTNYNMRLGGKGNRKGMKLGSPSEEHRKRLSQALKGKNAGRRASPETKSKMSKTHQGRTKTAEHQDRISSALRSTYEIEWANGHKEVFTGLKDFCAQRGLNPSCMTAVMTGRQKTHQDVVSVRLATSPVG